jgi:membrane-associated phospholipid phosphatase
MMKKLFLILFLLPHTMLFSQNLDIRILRSINSPGTLTSDNFFRFVSNSDAFIVAGIPAIMGSVALIKHDKNLFRNTEVLVGATVINLGVTTVLKYTVNRERPFITYSDIMKKSKGGSPSFPSGHTSGAFATATSISLSYPKWYIITPLYLWAGNSPTSPLYQRKEGRFPSAKQSIKTKRRTAVTPLCLYAFTPYKYKYPI